MNNDSYYEYMNSIFSLLTFSAIVARFRFAITIENGLLLATCNDEANSSAALLFFKEPAFGIGTDTFCRGLFELLIFKPGS